MTKEEYRKRKQEYEDARKIAEATYKNSMEELDNQAIEESGMLENVGRKCKAYGFRLGTDEKFWMNGGEPVYISEVKVDRWDGKCYYTFVHSKKDGSPSKVPSGIYKAAGVEFIE